jgi:hypothetical protein
VASALTDMGYSSAGTGGGAVCVQGADVYSGGGLLVGGDRVTTRREPNRLLASVMAEAGVSNKGLAARVRALARQDGRPISSDHVSVRRWLDGSVPRGRTPEYVALALSAKLGRRVTSADLGLGRVGHCVSNDLADRGTRYPDTCGDAVRALGELSSADLDDPDSVLELRWSSHVTAETITRYLFGQTNSDTVPVDPVGEPLTTAAIRGTAAHLMELDFAYGGGYVRRLLLFFFKSEVVPLLQQSSPDAVRREILSAAAEVAQLLAWSAYDSGRHGAAQRYFVQGLRLAREGHDHMLGGRLLSNLSHQANYLGKFEDAVQFARAAQSATLGKSSATVTAMFLAMEARALASIGDERGCTAVLNHAKKIFAKRVTDSDPKWIMYFNEEELAGEAAHCFQDLGHAALTRQFSDQAVQPFNTPPRTRAFITMVNAAGVLVAGEADEAVALALNAVDLAGPLQSKRYVRYLTDFHRSLTVGNSYKSLAKTFADRVMGVYPDVEFTVGT